MSVRIIDNKKLELTEDEFSMYKNICRAYDRPNFKGEELFQETFETDNNGIIIYLKPPGVKQSSMEVLVFVQSIMLHQHIRLMEDHIMKLSKKIDEKLNKLA